MAVTCDHCSRHLSIPCPCVSGYFALALLTEGNLSFVILVAAGALNIARYQAAYWLGTRLFTRQVSTVCVVGEGGKPQIDPIVLIQLHTSLCEVDGSKLPMPVLHHL